MTSTPAETRDAAPSALEIARRVATSVTPTLRAHNLSLHDIVTVCRALLASHGERDAVLEEAAKVADDEAAQADERYGKSADVEQQDREAARSRTSSRIADSIRSLKTGEG